MRKNPFENRVDAEIDEELAYKRAEKALALDRIRETDFEDRYGEENIRKDLAEIERLEADFENPPSKTSVILEAIIHEQSELNDWLGPKAHTLKASRYDDVKHGVDEIVEFTDKDEPGKKSHLVLGIDVTFSPNLSKKFKPLIERLSQGELTKVKYFRSSSLRGELTQIPQVVVGVDMKTLQEVVPHWLEHDTKTLATHPMQIIVLEEIRMQLEAFAEYADQAKKHDVANEYRASLQIIENILDQKSDLRKKFPLEALKDDEVFLGIFLELERLKKNLPKKP